MIVNALRSVFVTVMMGLSAYFGSLIYQCLHLWLAFISPKVFRWYIDITMFMWITSSISLIEWIMGTKFRLYGDKINSNEKAIIIMNHRTRLDWLYFYAILMRHGSSLRDEKIVLKDELKHIPGAGWAMQCGSYIFLKRSLNKDKQHLSNVIEYLSLVGHNTKILLFPEGTDLCQYSLERSNKFADKMNLQRFENVLHPRTAGFIHITQEMVRCFPDFDAIYDVTAAYQDTSFATNEVQFIKGNISSEVHFHCRRYSLKDIVGYNDQPVDQMELGEFIKSDDVSDRLKGFIYNAWNVKEKILDNYYHNDQYFHLKSLSFQAPEVQMPSVICKQSISVFLMCGNIFACLYAMLIIPKVSILIFIALNATFIYYDLFKNGIDEWAVKIALKDKYRIFKSSSEDNSKAESINNSTKID